MSSQPPPFEAGAAPRRSGENAEAAVASELAARIGGGDEKAEAELVERYGRVLLFFLRRQTGNPALADDLYQETFHIILLRLREGRLEEPAKLSSFLHRTARNLVIAHFRKTRRRKTDGDPEVIDRAVDAAPSQLGQSLRQERALLVRRLLGELRFDRDRQILYRYFVAEEDKEPICAALGLSTRHFDRVLYRAKQRFKDLLVSHQKRQGLKAPV